MSFTGTVSGLPNAVLRTFHCYLTGPSAFCLKTDSMCVFHNPCVCISVKRKETGSRSRCGLLRPVCSASDLTSVTLRGRGAGSFAYRNEFSTEGAGGFI